MFLNVSKYNFFVGIKNTIRKIVHKQSPKYLACLVRFVFRNAQKNASQKKKAFFKDLRVHSSNTILGQTVLYAYCRLGWSEKNYRFFRRYQVRRNKFVLWKTGSNIVVDVRLSTGTLPSYMSNFSHIF